MIAGWIALALLLALLVYREWWARRDLPRVHNAAFDGELFRVGHTVIARRAARGESERTIVCFPGFLEDVRYFQALYADAACELLLVNNANYHSPFPDAGATPLRWPDNPHSLGSIEHDGFVLGHAIRALANGRTIVLHGHSRGGAVVLEAGRQFPALMRPGERRVSAILEAPVLPQARVAGRGSNPLAHRLVCYLMPVWLGLARKSGPAKLQRAPMMRPTTSLKAEIVSSIYTVARNYRTCVANVRSIYRWQRDSDFSVFTHIPAVTVVMGERDDVLDNASMLASAKQGAALNACVSILRTEHTNHFIALERPEYLRTLVRPASAQLRADQAPTLSSSAPPLPSPSSR